MDKLRFKKFYEDIKKAFGEIPKSLNPMELQYDREF